MQRHLIIRPSLRSEALLFDEFHYFSELTKSTAHSTLWLPSLARDTQTRLEPSMHARQPAVIISACPHEETRKLNTYEYHSKWMCDG
jgi:Fe-S cluster assembly scaffold protein SufB